MPAPISVDQLPGPHGVPILGNLLDLNNPHPIDTRWTGPGSTARSTS